MTSYLKILFLFIFCFTLTEVVAQVEVKTSNTGWPVSKDVQRYSNRDLAHFRTTKVSSVGTPSVAQSKLVYRKKSFAPVTGNIRSEGAPDWVISKPVNLISR
jgi:hypothetical protein